MAAGSREPKPVRGWLRDTLQKFVSLTLCLAGILAPRLTFLNLSIWSQGAGRCGGSHNDDNNRKVVQEGREYKRRRKKNALC